jgi:hypothetical protein
MRCLSWSAALQVLRNLLFVAGALHHQRLGPAAVEDAEAETNADAHADADLTLGDAPDASMSRGLLWVLRRLSFMCRDPLPIRQLSILRCFAAIAVRLKVELVPYLVPIMQPVRHSGLPSRAQSLR